MKITKKEYKIIGKIADRALVIARDAQPGFPRDRIDIMMDVECCIETCPLNLDKLLAADNYTFAHDVFGIAQHLNRRTRRLENCFVPRCSI
jgi:hypothetical protein